MCGSLRLSRVNSRASVLCTQVAQNLRFCGFLHSSALIFFNNSRLSFVFSPIFYRLTQQSLRTVWWNVCRPSRPLLQYMCQNTTSTRTFLAKYSGFADPSWNRAQQFMQFGFFLCNSRAPLHSLNDTDNLLLLQNIANPWYLTDTDYFN